MKEVYQDEIESDQYWALQMQAMEMEYIKDDALEKTARSICVTRGIDPDELIVVENDINLQLLSSPKVNDCGQIETEGNSHRIVRKWQSLYTEAYAVLAAVKAQRTYFGHWHVE